MEKLAKGDEGRMERNMKERSEKENRRQRKKGKRK